MGRTGPHPCHPCVRAPYPLTRVPACRVAVQAPTNYPPLHPWPSVPGHAPIAMCGDGTGPDGPLGARRVYWDLVEPPRRQRSVLRTQRRLVGRTPCCVLSRSPVHQNTKTRICPWGQNTKTRKHGSAPGAKTRKHENTDLPPWGQNTKTRNRKHRSDPWAKTPNTKAQKHRVSQAKNCTIPQCVSPEAPKHENTKTRKHGPPGGSQNTKTRKHGPPGGDQNTKTRKHENTENTAWGYVGHRGAISEPP